MRTNMSNIRKSILKFEPTIQLFGHKPDSQTLVWMKPSEFLEKTPKLSQEHLNFSSTHAIINKLTDKIEKNIPIDPLFLDIDMVNCKVTGHEGRHRAMAAEKVGVARVPVIIYFMDDDRNYISVKEYLKQGCKCNYLDAQKQK